MLERKIQKFTESDSVLLYQRLTSIYQRKINAIDFTHNLKLNQAIKSRFLQHIVNQNFIKTRLIASKNPKRFTYTDDQLFSLIDDRSLNIEIDGKAPKSGQLQKNLKEYIKFWIFWFVMLLALCTFSRKSKISTKSPGSILYGCLEGFNKTEKDYKRIDQFLNNSDMVGISECRFFVFKGQKTIHKLGKNIIASRFPEAAFVFFSHFGTRGRFIAAIRHLFSFIQSHIIWLKNPFSIVIFSELAFIQISEELERKKLLKAIIFSTSNTTKYHLSAFLSISAHKHHIYYNIVPTNPVPKDDGRPDIGTLEPFFTLPSFGTHWVWSGEDAQLLTGRYKKTDVQVGGIPALFYAADNVLTREPEPNFDVIIFDVTPTDLQKFNPYGITYYYGRYETAVALIQHTIEAVQNFSVKNGLKPLKIAVKPKRKNETHHDMRYWEFLEKLTLKNEHFTVLEPDQDIFNLFHSKSIFISRPFTSAAHLAAINGCVSIYHDPNSEIADTGVKIKNLFFTSGKMNLINLLCSLLKARSLTN